MIEYRKWIFCWIQEALKIYWNYSKFQNMNDISFFYLTIGMIEKQQNLYLCHLQALNKLKFSLNSSCSKWIAIILPHLLKKLYLFFLAEFDSIKLDSFFHFFNCIFLKTSPVIKLFQKNFGQWYWKNRNNKSIYIFVIYKLNIQLHNKFAKINREKIR